MPFNTNNGIQGNDFAGLLIGFIGGDRAVTVINVSQSVPGHGINGDRIFLQDDWRAISETYADFRCALPMGYPFHRAPQQQLFSDSSQDDSGIRFRVCLCKQDCRRDNDLCNFEQSTRPGGLQQPWTTPGICAYGHRNTVIRGGAGIYFGYGVLTNYQYPGAAYTSSPTAFFSWMAKCHAMRLSRIHSLAAFHLHKVNSTAKTLCGVSQSKQPGYEKAKNANIYQWNLRVQQAFPHNIAVSIDYSANRSTFLPWAGTDNRNFIASSVRDQFCSVQTDVNGCTPD